MLYPEPATSNPQTCVWGLVASAFVLVVVGTFSAQPEVKAAQLSAAKKVQDHALFGSAILGSRSARTSMVSQPATVRQPEVGTAADSRPPMGAMTMAGPISERSPRPWVFTGFFTMATSVALGIWMMYRQRQENQMAMASMTGAWDFPGSDALEPLLDRLSTYADKPEAAQSCKELIMEKVKGAVKEKEAEFKLKEIQKDAELKLKEIQKDAEFKLKEIQKDAELIVKDAEVKMKDDLIEGEKEKIEFMREMVTLAQQRSVMLEGAAGKVNAHSVLESFLQICYPFKPTYTARMKQLEKEFAEFRQNSSESPQKPLHAILQRVFDYLKGRKVDDIALSYSELSFYLHHPELNFFELRREVNDVKSSNPSKQWPHLLEAILAAGFNIPDSSISFAPSSKNP